MLPTITPRTSTAAAAHDTDHNDDGCWLRGKAAERRSLIGELSLSHARPATDG